MKGTPMKTYTRHFARIVEIRRQLRKRNHQWIKHHILRKPA